MNRLDKIKLLFRYRRQVREVLATQLELLNGGHGADALGGLTEEETQGLCDFVRQVPAGRIVIEFGTLFGLTTQALAEAAPAGVTVMTIDNFCWNPFGLPPDLHRQFTKRILRLYLESGRVKLIDQDSAAFRNEYAGPVPGMVFFDADHTYEAVRDEIAWAKRLGVPIIAGHDYRNPAGFGVTQAVDEAFPEGVKTVGMIFAGKQCLPPQRRG